jgi:hypothetical protein
MTKPTALTRNELAKFLPDQRSIRAFEQLFDAVPADILEAVLTSGIADSKATNALAVAEGIKRLAELAALAPLPQEHNSVNTDYVEFNQFANHELSPVQMGWGTENGTLEIGMGYDAVIQHVGLESYYRIKATAAITKGQLVMLTGAVGASGVVTGAPATGITDGQYIMGVATMDIPNNQFGYVTHFGVVRGFITNGASVGETWNDGDILWYNPSYAGGLTNVQPASPTPEIIVCVVITASSGNNGSVLVRPTFMPRLDQLTGVDISSPSADDLLQYDGTSWVNRSGLFTNIYDNGTESTRVATGTTAQRPAAPVTGDIRFNTTDSKLEFYNGTDWCQISCPPPPVSATGGTETTITDGGVTYKVHTFTSSGTLTVTSGGEVEYLVVAGGGGGGYGKSTGTWPAGGGGGGGYREASGTLAAGSYGVTIGAGGSAGASATSGSDSIFNATTSAGGGRGGGDSTNVNRIGASGGSGGGGANAAGGSGNTPATTPSQGNNGGGGSGGGGGGGGASAIGADGTGSGGGNGGAGLISIDLNTYAGGGGGGSGFSAPSGGTGGVGGGGNGGQSGSNNGTAGAPNTGGGGGGGRGDSSEFQGSNGGSGIVIIRYPI